MMMVIAVVTVISVTSFIASSVDDAADSTSCRMRTKLFRLYSVVVSQAKLVGTKEEIRKI